MIVRFRQSVVISRFEPPGQHTLQNLDASAKRFAGFGFHSVLECRFESLERRLILVLLRGREELWCGRDQHLVQTLVQMFALFQAEAPLCIELSKLLVDRGHSRLVVGSPKSDDVLECIETSLPIHEFAPHVGEVEIVLQRGLKVVGSHQRDQVEGLWCFRQTAQPDHPVFVFANLLALECLQELASIDAADRSIQLFEFAAE